MARDADAKTIKKKFYELAKKYHPDANPDNAEAAKKFSEISAAYEVLSDKDKRSKYDMFGHDAEQMGDGGMGGTLRTWAQYVCSPCTWLCAAHRQHVRGCHTRTL